MDSLKRSPAADRDLEPLPPALPEPAPFEMSVQSLRSFVGSPRKQERPSSPRKIVLRRAVLLGATLLLTAFGAREMHLALAVGGVTLLEWLILLLFVTLLAWIAFSCISAIAGFSSLIRGGECRLGLRDEHGLPALSTRTALLMPIYNEDPARVMAGLQAMHESLVATGRIDRFAWFILSDTTDADIWICEEAEFLALRDRIGGSATVFYRRRPKNVERKAGNIADWVRSFGAAYPQMLILDADSVMSGETIVRLAAAMERNSDVGLIQTYPVIVNGETLFTRLQRFAGRVYGELIAHGLAWWHGAEGNYWGHNAIIRTKAFAEHAGLPRLRGRAPFGGHILSHDFIEAALIRRGGWAVHMVPELTGSYEEAPPSLSDIAVRDRRWCQGNLQHAAVLGARRFHWISRLHLLMGIGAYLTAPLWLLFLLAGLMAALQTRFVLPEYFGDEPSLFPSWPAQDPVRSMWVFAGTIAVLLLPKLLAYCALVLRPADCRGCGGAGRAFVSIMIETIIAGLLAPVMMLFQSGAVVSILLGRDSGWRPQRRHGGEIPFAELVRHYGPQTVLGVSLGVASWLVAPDLLLWMSPVVLGLTLAIPLAALTSARRPSEWFQRLKLLRTPEEDPPPVLARAGELRHASPPDFSHGVSLLLKDPRLRRLHLEALPPPRRPREGPFDPALLVGLAKLEEAESLSEALAVLTPAEKLVVLADRRGIERLVALANSCSSPPGPMRAPTG